MKRPTEGGPFRGLVAHLLQVMRDGSRCALAMLPTMVRRSLLDEVPGVEVLDRDRQDDARPGRHAKRDGGVVELGHNERVVDTEEQPQVVVLVHEPPLGNRRAVQVDAHVGGRRDSRTSRRGHSEPLRRVSMRYSPIITYIYN